MRAPAGDSERALLGSRVGNYRVETLLGSGGTSDVYLLRHHSLTDTYLAMKVLRDVRLPPGSFCRPAQGGSHTASDSMPSLLVERFEQEARVAAALGSPSVVAPLDIGQLEDGTPYILMEYVRGVSLAEELKRCGPIHAAKALAIGRQIAGTLVIAHAKGIVHRDLKPANIMLDENGSVRLLDFGAARVSGALRVVETTQQGVLGTPGFIAPEVLSGQDADTRADVYSLGVTLFQMLTGELPFPNQSSFATARAMLAGPAPKVKDRRSAVLDPVPAHIEQLVSRSLSCDPAMRPSVVELARELSEAEPDRPGASARAARSRRWIAAVALGALGLALVSRAALSQNTENATEALRVTPLLHRGLVSTRTMQPLAPSLRHVPATTPPAPTAAQPAKPHRPSGTARARTKGAGVVLGKEQPSLQLRDPSDAIEWMED
ncbi:MAG TPA: serine/threonine-protein kinase [Polyangiaceae bacterium]|nr:serine/threonine-protein kinase [Polyangiaceae bacterium]